MRAPVKRIGPAADGTVVEADINLAEQRIDTTIDLADAKFQRQVARLHQYGPRAEAEFLARLGAVRMCRSEIEIMLEEYLDRLARLDPAVVRQLDADCVVPFPQPRLIESAR